MARHVACRQAVQHVAYGYDTLIARSARQGHWVLISTFRVLGTNRRIPIARRVPRRIAWPIARRSTRRVAWKEKRRRSCEEVLNALATFHRLRYAYERRRTHLTARTFAQWSVSRVLATCPVAMCSLALRKFLHLSEFFLVIADSSTSYLTNCSDFPKMGMFAIVAEGY